MDFNFMGILLIREKTKKSKNPKSQIPNLKRKGPQCDHKLTFLCLGAALPSLVPGNSNERPRTPFLLQRLSCVRSSTAINPKTY